MPHTEAPLYSVFHEDTAQHRHHPAMVGQSSTLKHGTTSPLTTYTRRFYRAFAMLFCYPLCCICCASSPRVWRCRIEAELKSVERRKLPLEATSPPPPPPATHDTHHSIETFGFTLYIITTKLCSTNTMPRISPLSMLAPRSFLACRALGLQPAAPSLARYLAADSKPAGPESANISKDGPVVAKDAPIPGRRRRHSISKLLNPVARVPAKGESEKLAAAVSPSTPLCSCET